VNQDDRLIVLVGNNVWKGWQDLFGEICQGINIKSKLVQKEQSMAGAKREGEGQGIRLNCHFCRQSTLKYPEFASIK
jgi:hypothetical protein